MYSKSACLVVLLIGSVAAVGFLWCVKTKGDVSYLLLTLLVNYNLWKVWLPLFCNLKENKFACIPLYKTKGSRWVAGLSFYGVHVFWV